MAKSSPQKATVLPPFHGTNLFFVQCLKKLKAEAEESGSKSVYTYAKAITSILKYPSKLTSGKETEAINGIGAKTADVLEKSLEEYRNTKGEPDPADFEDCVPAAAKKRFKRSTELSASPSSSKKDGRVMIKKSCRRSGEYIPQPRSGAFAILVALYQHHENPMAETSDLTKDQLIALAQHLCDASFTIPDPKTTYYTAWNSMKTLNDKGFVEKTSMPPKYSLSAAGIELASRLANATTVPLNELAIRPNDPVNTVDRKRSLHTAGMKRRIKNAEKVSQRIEPTCDIIVPVTKIPKISGTGNKATSNCRENKMISVPSCSDQIIVDDPTNALSAISNCAMYATTSTQKLPTTSERSISIGRLPSTCYVPPDSSDLKTSYIYISPDGVEAASKKDAMFIFPGVGCYCLVKIPKNLLLHKSFHFRSIPTDQLPSIPTVVFNNYKFTLAMLKEAIADELAPGISEDFENHNSHSEDMLRRDTGTDSEAGANLQNKFSKIKPVKALTKTNDFVGFDHQLADQSQNDHLPACSNAGNLNSTFSCDDENELDWTLSDRLELAGVASGCSSDPEPVASSGKPGMFTFYPGQFRIVLCVDNQEALGGSACARKAKLEQSLRQKQVSFDRRKLNVGDFLWVAQELLPSTTAPADGPPLCRELVLDCIVERKRMDDLAASMIDKRYYEQKTRLKQCGLRRILYLVEDFGGKTENLPIPRTTLERAIENTRIQDQFCIHRTESVDDSVAWLCSFTSYLAEVFEAKTLTACLRSDIQKQIPVEFSDNRMSLMTFEEFQKSSIKDAPVSVRLFFGKQLMQIKGVSAEKARLITEKYPTLRSLLKAYDDCGSDADREALLKHLKATPASQALGIALSRKIANFYCHMGNFEN